MRWVVKERRCYIETTVIDAVDEDAARRLEGEIVESDEGDSWADAIESVEHDQAGEA